MKFYLKAQDPKNCVPMIIDQSELFIQAVLIDRELKSYRTIPGDKMSFVMQVIAKRIEVDDLPIDFTIGGFIAAHALAEGSPGKAVSILIDCLDKYQGETVSSKEMSELYPWGFYKDEVFRDYIDNYLKLRKTKWAHLY